jgi:hypothetical protein
MSDTEPRGSTQQLAATVAVRLTRQEADAVRTLAQATGLAVSSVLRQAVRQVIEPPMTARVERAGSAAMAIRADVRQGLQVGTGCTWTGPSTREVQIPKLAGGPETPLFACGSLVTIDGAGGNQWLGTTPPVGNHALSKWVIGDYDVGAARLARGEKG